MTSGKSQEMQQTTLEPTQLTQETDRLSGEPAPYITPDEFARLQHEKKKSPGLVGKLMRKLTREVSMDDRVNRLSVPESGKKENAEEKILALFKEGAVSNNPEEILSAINGLEEYRAQLRSAEGAHYERVMTLPVPVHGKKREIMSPISLVYSYEDELFKKFFKRCAVQRNFVLADSGFEAVKKIQETDGSKETLWNDYLNALFYIAMQTQNAETVRIIEGKLSRILYSPEFAKLASRNTIVSPASSRLGMLVRNIFQSGINQPAGETSSSSGMDAWLEDRANENHVDTIAGLYLEPIEKQLQKLLRK